MTDTTEPKRPRIVRPRDDSEASAADKQDDYQFFAFAPSERTEAVKKKIEEREKALLELQMMEAMLDGNPNPGKHEDEAQRKVKTPDGQEFTRPCNCGTCELKRVKDAIEGLEYGLSKLRALHARLVG